MRVFLMRILGRSASNRTPPEVRKVELGWDFTPSLDDDGHREGEPMEIRDFESGDRANVIALWRACGLVVPGKNDPEADIDFAVASADAAILVGVAEDEIAATVMVGHDGHRGWLYYVAVAPARQRRGLGWRMVEEAEAWLRRRGAPKAQLLIRETNTQVEAFYARLGYATIPRIVMQKVL